MQATVNNRDIQTTIQTLPPCASSSSLPVPVSPVISTYDDGLSAFLGLRPRLFGIAYRMLGSAAEAEDIVQDVWVRWQTTDRSVVRNAAAFLVTTATRLAINVLQSARSRRETCVGPCPPEPVDTTPDPRLRAEQGQALAVGVELLLERLTSTERAAYILREAFDYPYRDIANVLRLGEANARQVVTRARRHVASGRRMAAHSPEAKHVFSKLSSPRLSAAKSTTSRVSSLPRSCPSQCLRLRHDVTTRLRIWSMADRNAGLQIRDHRKPVGGTSCKAQLRRRPRWGATHMRRKPQFDR